MDTKTRTIIMLQQLALQTSINLSHITDDIDLNKDIEYYLKRNIERLQECLDDLILNTNDNLVNIATDY